MAFNLKSTLHQINMQQKHAINQLSQRPRFGQLGIRASTTGARPSMMQKFTVLTPRKK